MAVSDFGKSAHEILEDLAGMRSDDIHTLSQKIIWGDAKKDAAEFANNYPDPILDRLIEDRKRKTEPGIDKIRNIIWGEDYSWRFDKAMEVIRGERAAKKLPDGPFTPRHSGRYPWGKVDSIEERDVGVYCKCTLNNSLPSQGCLFANKRHIREHILQDFDIQCYNYTYLYVNNGIRCKIVIGRDDIMRIDNEHGTEAVWTLIVDRLAEQYDKAMTERMFNMKYEDYRRIHDRINHVSGSMSIDYGSIGEPAVAKIEVPVEKLGELFGVTPTPSILRKRFTIGMPKVEDVQFFNDRATIVKFTDGTQTRSVCDGNDLFQPDVGIAYCLFKRYLGGEKVGHARFNDLMRQARQAIQDRKDEKAIEAKHAAVKKAQKQKALEVAKRRKARKDEKKRNDLADAVVYALKRYDGFLDEHCEENVKNSEQSVGVQGVLVKEEVQP